MSNYIDSIQLSGTVYTIQGTGGGGKAIEAGRGISITTGETADTVSFNLPISAGTGAYSIAEGSGTEASGDYSHAEGDRAKAQGSSSHAEGRSTIASGNRSHAEGQSTRATGIYSHAEGCITQANGAQSHAEGYYTIANNVSEHASGQYNVSSSASTTFGDSGNTLFSVGNGTDGSTRHNAFEIRQNGDIYLSSGGTDIKLQDHLGGGGSITIDPSLDSGSTNPVANSAITNNTLSGGVESNNFFRTVRLWRNNGQVAFYKRFAAINGNSVMVDGTTEAPNFQLVETSAITTSVTSASTDSEIPSAKAVNDKLGGLKLVKLTQSAYDALSPNYDSNTLYVIVN